MTSPRSVALIVFAMFTLGTAVGWSFVQYRSPQMSLLLEVFSLC